MISVRSWSLTGATAIAFLIAAYWWLSRVAAPPSGPGWDLFEFGYPQDEIWLARGSLLLVIAGASIAFDSWRNRKSK